MLQKLSYMCGASPAEYVGTGDRDKNFLANIYLLENISFTSKTELPITIVLLRLLLCNRVHLLWRWWHTTHIKQISGAPSTVPNVLWEPNRI